MKPDRFGALSALNPWHANMTLTKVDLVGQLIGQSGMDRTGAQRLVDQMFKEITCSLEKGEEVKLAGFGSRCLFLEYAMQKNWIGHKVDKQAKQCVPVHANHTLSSFGRRVCYHLACDTVIVHSPWERGCPARLNCGQDGRAPRKKSRGTERLHATTDDIC